MDSLFLVLYEFSLKGKAVSKSNDLAGEITIFIFIIICTSKVQIIEELNHKFDELFL
jgi:hypothetical protein